VMVKKNATGAEWMPWHNEPMKDAQNCDKPG